ncbi:MAG: hypothetical protein ACOYN0_05865 [Phycisphaerales bacterium]
MRLGNSEGLAAAGWAAQRWARVVELAAAGEQVKEGLEYAKLGQTKRIGYVSGRIEASVQGRAHRAYSTIIRMTPFTPEQWDRVVVGLTEGAVYAAKLLAGEMPANIEDVFIPLGLKLFPTETSDVSVACTCTEYMAAATSGAPEFWCKHVCSIAHLFADRLSAEPFLMFSIRGVDGPDLLERLRQRRAVVSAALGATPVYPQRIPGVSDIPNRPLDEEIERFWEAGQELHSLDIPVEAPPVSHPLLRRLGPSPFTGAQFPLVGLLASCYEVVSADAVRVDEPPRADSDDELGDDPEADLEADPDED